MSEIQFIRPLMSGLMPTISRDIHDYSQIRALVLSVYIIVSCLPFPYVYLCLLYVYFCFTYIFALFTS